MGGEGEFSWLFIWGVGRDRELGRGGIALTYSLTCMAFMLPSSFKKTGEVMGQLSWWELADVHRIGRGVVKLSVPRQLPGLEMLGFFTVFSLLPMSH